MSKVAAVLACALLAACGDKSKDEAAGPGFAGAMKSGEPMTSAEIAEAIRRARESGPDGAATAKAVEDLTARMKDIVGDDPMGAAAKAQAAVSRPLTTADVEVYVAVAPSMRSIMGKPAEAKAILQKHGMALPEWGVLSSRIQMALAAIKSGTTTGMPTTAADVEVVRPHADRLEKAQKGK